MTHPRRLRTLAYCNRRGVIEFTTGALPDGMLPLISGPRRSIARKISAHARHGYDGKLLLVPGVPEAADDRAALDAVHAFLDRLKAPVSRARAAATLNGASA